MLLAFTMWSCEKYDLDDFQGKEPPQLLIIPAEGVIIFDRTEVSKTKEKVFVIKIQEIKTLL